MKFTFKYNKRHSMYVTLFACGASIWMMVVRFGLPASDLLIYLAITLCLFAAVLSCAALLAYILRRIRND